MRKLKVTWQDGSWDQPGQPTSSVDVPVHVMVADVGGSLVFRDGASGSRVYLVIPESRLISAVEIDTEEATNA